MSKTRKHPDDASHSSANTIKNTAQKEGAAPPDQNAKPTTGVVDLSPDTLTKEIIPPDRIQAEVQGKAPSSVLQSMVNLSKTCKTLHTLFKTDLEQARIDTFLHYVARGKQEQAEAMLKEYPELLLKKGTITEYIDYSGYTDYSNLTATIRTFDNITAFQYALWALDTHMWQMMLKYLPKDVAKQQLQELDEHGTIHGKQTTAIFDIEKALQAFVDYYDHVDWNQYASHQEDNEIADHQPNPNIYRDKVDQELRERWLLVGEAQRKSPVHVIQEYRHPTRSFANASFDLSEGLPRNIKFSSEIAFFSSLAHANHFNVEPGMATLFRGKWRNKNGLLNYMLNRVALAILFLCPMSVWRNIAGADLAAMRRLGEKRANDRSEFKKHLNRQSNLQPPNDSTRMAPP
ncbi:MAG TPA: hypothetical protein VJN02_02445 [Gammaproteobacteria bacterium]|nr:hypothetical protein [Gammaproteobacteria bacterium]